MRFSDARATYTIAAVTLVVSGLVSVSGLFPYVAIAAGFIPLRIDGAALPIADAVPAWATPLSATLVHGGFAHLLLNLLMLVYCGQQAERAVGTRGIVILYVVGAFAAAVGHWLFEPGSPVPMIGASGAISAVVAAYALLYGRRRAKAVGPVPGEVVHIAWLAASWIGIQLLFGFAGFGGGGAPVAIGAHIGGFLAGLALARPLLLWRYKDA